MEIITVFGMTALCFLIYLKELIYVTICHILVRIILCSERWYVTGVMFSRGTQQGHTPQEQEWHTIQPLDFSTTPLTVAVSEL